MAFVVQMMVRISLSKPQDRHEFCPRVLPVPDDRRVAFLPFAENSANASMAAASETAV
jgi:hypothetical protein